MQNKRGLEMAMGTIVAIVLGLIILIILIIFAQRQVTKGGEKLGEIGKEAEYAADKCQSIIKGTFCAAAGKRDPKKYDEKSSSPAGPWIDCGKTLKDKPVCCVPKETA